MSALRNDDIDTSRRFYEKLKRRKIEHPRLIALGARISLLEDDTLAAKPLLEEALVMCETRVSDNAKYMAIYCRYFLSLIERDERHEEYRKAALSLKPTRFYLDTLPLPDRSITLAEVDRMNQFKSEAIH